MEKRFAIFDLDGTLVDSMPYWQQEIRDFLAARGVTENVAEILDRVKPLAITETTKLLVRQFGFPDDPAQAAADITARMGERYRNSLPLKEGVKEYAETLKRRGVRMCVASATPVYLMDACLTRLGVRNLFEFAIACGDVGAGKDHPDIYYAAAKRLGASPEEIAVFEDSDNAMRTAKGAGFYGVGVYDPQGAAQWEELQALADEVIPDWTAAAREL